MAGKDKLTRGVRFKVDDSGGTLRDLSGDLIPGSASGFGFDAPEVDMTGESETVTNFLADRLNNEITARFHANTTATTGASTVLNGILQKVVTVTGQIGSGGAAPTTGDLEFSGEYVCLKATLVSDGGRMVHDCVFKPTGSTPPAWGTVA